MAIEWIDSEKKSFGTLEAEEYFVRIVTSQRETPGRWYWEYDCTLASDASAGYFHSTESAKKGAVKALRDHLNFLLKEIE